MQFQRQQLHLVQQQERLETTSCTTEQAHSPGPESVQKQIRENKMKQKCYLFVANNSLEEHECNGIA